MIPKISFKQSKKLDVRNYFDTVNSSSPRKSFIKSMPAEFVAGIKGKKFEEVEDLIKEQVDKDYEERGGEVEALLINLQSEWKKVEKEYFKRLEEIHKKPFIAKQVGVYPTMLSRCDYNYNKKNPYFKVDVNRSAEDNVVTMMHEMIHFMFHWHYWNFCRKHLSEKMTWHLKESLSFLINEEFSDLVKIKDKGYPEHYELRKKLIKIWREDKDFIIFIEKSIELMKQINIKEEQVKDKK